MRDITSEKTMPTKRKIKKRRKVIGHTLKIMVFLVVFLSNYARRMIRKNHSILCTEGSIFWMLLGFYQTWFIRQNEMWVCKKEISNIKKKKHNLTKMEGKSLGALPDILSISEMSICNINTLFLGCWQVFDSRPIRRPWWWIYRRYKKCLAFLLQLVGRLFRKGSFHRISEEIVNFIIVNLIYSFFMSYDCHYVILQKCNSVYCVEI